MEEIFTIFLLDQNFLIEQDISFHALLKHFKITFIMKWKWAQPIDLCMMESVLISKYQLWIKQFFLNEVIIVNGRKQPSASQKSYIAPRNWFLKQSFYWTFNYWIDIYDSCNIPIYFLPLTNL